ncbi:MULTISPECIES: hypothetical protein [unclassified Prochlorococcus]|uniref:hypothetical protein n=1 Tax=unclassified Prochlorococcus TaxID=2627481 RepID=UPI00053378B2|nr:MULTISPECIES: hypothetical protein [unclassified Prochlorococcus]KGG16682.1 hypothetical protein EV06_0524 [Prochlorococcus sp. MIT 0602]KGG18346.1 hypothetical protein EV07_0262 [Prochlorococcus sp. MIT 0603]
MTNVIAIDPGHKKCGLLLAEINGLNVIDGKTVEKSSVIKLINSWRSAYSVELILLGNGTTSKYWNDQLSLNGIGIIKVVDEAMTTLRAKTRYLELCPPKLVFRWLPSTLIFPPKHLDAIVALILIEDYYQKKFNWEKPIEIRIWP